jgi:hypothetical protein
VKDEKIAYRLSRLICFHQSEWWVDSEIILGIGLQEDRLETG